MAMGMARKHLLMDPQESGTASGHFLEERRLLVDLLLMAALMDTAGVAADGRIDNWHGA